MRALHQQTQMLYTSPIGLVGSANHSQLPGYFFVSIACLYGAVLQLKNYLYTVSKKVPTL